MWLFGPDVLRHLSGVYHLSSPALILLRQVGRCLLVFNYTMDTSTQFGYTHAMFSPLIAPFVVLGFAVALRRWREPGPALALSFWALTLALGGFLTVDAPFWPRLVGIVAPASIFAGLALQTLAAFLASRAPRFAPAIPAALAGLVVWAAVSSYAVYRHDMSENARTYAFIGRYLASLPRDVTACAAESPFEIEIREVAFLAWPRQIGDGEGGGRRAGARLRDAAVRLDPRPDGRREPRAAEGAVARRSLRASLQATRARVRELHGPRR